MAAIYFTNIVKRITGVDLSKASQISMNWFRKLVSSINRKDVNTSEIIDTKEPFKRVVKLSETSVGKMYLFTYDAKYKDTLPYWDFYPLVIPIEYYGDSFLGLNMHYLPPVARAQLFDALTETINNTKMDKTTKMKINYQILKNASKYRLFKPCVHKYLFTHVKSNFLYISPQEWGTALLLPTQKFVSKTRSGVTVEQVYKDSMKKV